MTNATREREVQFDRPMRLAGIVGIAAAVLGVIGLFIAGADAFFQAYLFAFVFWLGISLGLLALLLLHHLMGTHWGLTIRRVAEAGATSIWLMGVLFIPLLLGLDRLYPWTDTEAMHANEMLAAKTFYLNVPFFIARAVVYFAVWLALAYFANRLSTRGSSRAANPADAAADATALRDRRQTLGAAGLILYVLTMTFAAIDWLMSLQPFWSSTIFGLLIIVGQILTAMAFALVALNLFPSLSLGRRWTHKTTPVPYSDLGALMFTFVFGWGYLAYFQMLIIWSANIPREAVWYTARIEGGWNVLAIIIAVFQFILPFLVLLSGRVRRNLRLLGILGLVLLFTYLVNVFWHVKPAFYPGQFAISWLDIVLPAAMGGLWMAVFLYHLARRPALTPVEETALHLRDQVHA